MKKISYADLEWAFSELADENERLQIEIDDLILYNQSLKDDLNENTGTSVHPVVESTGTDSGAKSAV